METQESREIRQALEAAEIRAATLEAALTEISRIVVGEDKLPDCYEMQPAAVVLQVRYLKISALEAAEQRKVPFSAIGPGGTD